MARVTRTEVNNFGRNGGLLQMKQVKEILAEMIASGKVGQSWLSDAEHKKKIAEREKRRNQEVKNYFQNR